MFSNKVFGPIVKDNIVTEGNLLGSTGIVEFGSDDFENTRCNVSYSNQSQNEFLH